MDIELEDNKQFISNTPRKHAPEFEILCHVKIPSYTNLVSENKNFPGFIISSIRKEIFSECDIGAFLGYIMICSLY